MLIIKFKGNQYLLTEGGAITTPTDYANFLPSYAHLYEDGTISRYGTVIGCREDIEILRPATEKEQKIGGMEKVLQNLGRW